MTDPLLDGSVATIDEVLARLDALQAHLVATRPRGAKDGVASFNYLYRTITADVLAGTKSQGFADAEFIRNLDVAFANRYLDALRRDATVPGSAPAVWQALIDARDEDHIGQMRFAMAGVNAHINFDLAFALLTTCETMQVELDVGRHHDAYQQVNDIFAENMEKLRRYYESWWQRAVDRVVRHVANWGGDLAVVLTRDVAWNNALWMWPKRTDQQEITEHTAQMDYLATLLTHGILFPVL
jgi:hypothetical protein